MNRNELTDMILDTRKTLSFYEEMKTDCTSCENFTRSNFCVLWKQEVPEEHQKIGCDQWSFDDVPF